MERHSTLANHLKPLILKYKGVSRRVVNAGTGGTGGGDLGAHELGDPTIHLGTLPWGRLNFSGASLASIPTRNHNLLGALTSDDHTQYVHNTTARIITARHTFNPSSAASPFVLGANALAQLVTGLNAQYVGGELESVFMRRSATSNLNMNGYIITSNDADTAHLLGRAATGYVGHSNHAGFAYRDHASATNYALIQDSSGNTIVNRPTGVGIYFRENNATQARLLGSNLEFYSAVGLKSNNYASQTTGWGITYAGAGDFRYLFTDELHAKVFIADLEQALAGGQIISKSVAILSRDFTAPAAGAAATLYVQDLPSAENMAVFQSGDIVRIRTSSRASGSLTIANCWGVVTSYSNLTGKEQSWTFTRSSGSNAGTMTAGTVVGADAIILDYGTTGNGFYEVNAIDGLYAVNSPYMQIVTWTTHPATGSTVRLRAGNLTGVGFTGEYGLYAAGGSTGAQYLKASDDSFILAGGPSGSTVIDDAGIDIDVGTSFANNRSYTFSAGGTHLGRFGVYQNVNIVGLELSTAGVTNNDSLVYVSSSANGSGKYADAYMVASHSSNSGDPAQMRLYANATKSEITAYADTFYMDANNKICFGEQDAIISGYINIYMGGTGHLYARFPNGTIRELAAD